MTRSASPSRSLAALVGVLATLLAALLLAACGGSSGGDDAGSGTTAPGGGGGSSASSTTYDFGGGGGGSTAPSGEKGGKVRIVNAFAPKGQDGTAGEAIDVYDTPNPGKDDEPLISNLGYGEISDYVQPRSNFGSNNLWIFPTGTKERSDDLSTGAGQSLSNGGFDKGTQRTLVIGSTESIEDKTKNQPVYQEILEVGAGDLTVQDSWKAIPGKGVLLFNDRGAGTDQRGFGFYAVIDGECQTRIDKENGPSQGQGVESLANGNAVPFEVAPGSHEVQILVAPFDNGLSTCDLTKSVVTETVDVKAGGRTEVFLISPKGDDKDLKVISASVPG